jgi:hypothetical protein
LANFYKDTGRWPNMTSAGAVGLTLLAGLGNTPTAAGAAAAWNTTAINGTQGDLLTYHLVVDRPGNQVANIYPQNVGELSWRGPYMQAIPGDPWGNRYMANIGNITTAMIGGNAVWIISAGPDGIVQTAFNQAVPATGAAVLLAGDDIGFRLK